MKRFKPARYLFIFAIILVLTPTTKGQVPNSSAAKATYAIAEVIPLTEKAWQNLETKGVAEEAITRFFYELGKTDSEAPASVVSSLKALQNAKLKIIPWLIGRASLWLETQSLIDILNDAKPDEVEDFLKRANDLLQNYVVEDLPPLPAGVADYLNPDIRQQVDTDFALGMASREVDSELRYFRGGFYKLLKKIGYSDQSREASLFSPKVKALLAKDLSALTAEELLDRLFTEHQDKIARQPQEIPYKSKLPPDRSKMH